MHFHEGTVHLSRTNVVRCKRCQQTIPTKTSGIPPTAIVVSCTFCLEKRRYLPSEVFTGKPSYGLTKIKG
jgi:hypothetical protein